PASALHIVPLPLRARQNEIASADITVIPQPWHGRLSRLPLLRTLQPLDNSAHVARRILTRGYHFSIPLPHRAHHGFRAGIPSQPPAHLAGKARVAEIRNHHLDAGRRQAGGRDLRRSVEPPRGHAWIPPRSRCGLLLLEHHPGQVPRQRLRRHPEGSLHPPGLPRLQTNLRVRPPRPQSGPEQKIRRQNGQNLQKLVRHRRGLQGVCPASWEVTSSERNVKKSVQQADIASTRTTPY